VPLNKETIAHMHPLRVKSNELHPLCIIIGKALVQFYADQLASHLKKSHKLNKHITLAKSATKISEEVVQGRSLRPRNQIRAPTQYQPTATHSARSSSAQHHSPSPPQVAVRQKAKRKLEYEDERPRKLHASTSSRRASSSSRRASSYSASPAYDLTRKAIAAREQEAETIAREHARARNLVAQAEEEEQIALAHNTARSDMLRAQVELLEFQGKDPTDLFKQLSSNDAPVGSDRI
jgi:hypothetical protein